MYIPVTIYIFVSGDILERVIMHKFPSKPEVMAEEGEEEMNTPQFFLISDRGNFKRKK
jgi:hypothetical protein